MWASRAIHLLTALSMVVGAFLTKEYIPELWADNVTKFATIGGFATFYGVVFAVIETWRARSASESAKAEIVALYDVRDYTECLTCLRTVIQDLERSGIASTAALTRVIELYAAQFHASYDDPGSKQRERVARLQSYMEGANGRYPKGERGRLTTVLTDILQDVIVDASSKFAERKS